MSFCIKRIEENCNGQTISPERYNDLQQAERAVKQKLDEYKNSGYDAQHDHWWARDDKGNKFKFVIEPVGAE